MGRKNKDGDHEIVHDINLGLLLEELRRCGPLTRKELSTSLHISPSALTRLVSSLSEAALIRPVNEGRTRRLEINPEAGVIIGIDFQDHCVSAIATDFCANVLWHHQVPADVNVVKSQRIHLAEALIDDAMNDMRERNMRTLGIGVSLPGLIDRDHGVLLYAPNLSWANVPLVDSWSTKFALPVFIENNANAGGIGEHFLGVGQNADSLIYLDLGMGIGGCIIIEGRLFTGSSGYAGEVGHMRVIPNGPRCGCGRRGCFEAVAGAEAVTSEIGARIANGDTSLLSETASDPESPTIAELAHAAARKDPLVRTVLTETADHLGHGIANLVNVLDPQLVVLGGTMAPLVPFMRETINASMKENSLLQPCRAQLVDSAYGDQASLVGAVAIVMRKVTQTPTRWLNEKD